jgi:hypothetical protein
LSELSKDWYSLARSVFLEDLRNNQTNIVSGNSDSEVGLEEVGEIKSVASGVTRLKESVKSVVS